MGYSNTIILGSAENGALSYKQYIDIAMKGNMYEKKALGIMDEKKRLHDHKITTGNKEQIEKTNELNKPTFDTTKITKAKLQNIQESFKNALNNQTNKMQLVSPKGQSESVEYIPLMSASSHTAGNQSVKKPLGKKKRKKDEEIEDEYYIKESSETDLFVYWEFEKQFLTNA